MLLNKTAPYWYLLRKIVSLLFLNKSSKSFLVIYLKYILNAMLLKLKCMFFNLLIKKKNYYIK